MINCRICKGKLKKIVDLGKIALVGDFIKKLKKQKKYKISINFCSICKHVQIAEILNPNLLFKKYLWETGVSSSNILLIKNLIKKIKKYGINKNSKILEIASNDGSLLSFIKCNPKSCSAISLPIAPNKNSFSSLFKEIISLIPIEGIKYLIGSSSPNFL